jgi:hypothetical protein
MIVYLSIFLSAIAGFAQGTDDHTALRRFTPHHRTGARLVAQSKVNRLMNQRITSTGMGARRTSVRLRKGRADILVSSQSHLVWMGC